MPENLRDSLSGLGQKEGRLRALLCSPNTPSLLTATLLPNMAPHTQIHGASRCPLLYLIQSARSNIPPRLSLLPVLCFDHKSRMNSCQYLFLPGNLSFWICPQHYDRRHHDNRTMWFCVCSGLNLLLAQHFLNYLLTSNPFFITYLLWTSSSLQPVLTRNEDSSPMAHVGMAALDYTSHGHSTPRSQSHPLSTLRLLFHSCHPSLQLHSHPPSSVPSSQCKTTLSISYFWKNPCRSPSKTTLLMLHGEGMFQTGFLSSTQHLAHKYVLFQCWYNLKTRFN